MKKKIIFIIPNLRCGGAPKVLSLICQNLDNNKYEVVLICINLIDAFYKITNPAVRVINLNKRHIKSSFFSIYSILKKEKPDLVFSNGQDLNILMGFFKLYFRKKIKFICRETSVLSGNNKNLKLKRVYSFLIRRLYNKMDKIICQSKEMYTDLAEKYHIQKQKLKIIYNPVVEPESFKLIPMFNERNVIKLLSIGRLSPEKGNMRLLHIISLLKIPYQLIILGDGPEKIELQREVERLNISNQVIFKGAVTNTNEYIADCDAVLLSTYNEGFPNIVLEAGILGKPVIAFKVPGVDEEVIENGVTGFLINSTNHQDFCDAIEKLQTIEFNSEKIRQKILYKYSIQKIASDYDNLFDQVHAAN